MSGPVRDYVALHAQFLWWALTQEFDYVLSHNFTPPDAGSRPSFKAELLATSSYSGQRSGRGMARTASRGRGSSLQRRRADGALP